MLDVYMGIAPQAACHGVAGMRCHTGPQDQWAAIREWLVEHRVEPPERALQSDVER